MWFSQIMEIIMKIKAIIVLRVLILVFVLAGLFTGIFNPFREGPVTSFEQTEFNVMGFTYSTDVFSNSTRWQRLRMFTNQSNIFIFFVVCYLLFDVIKGKQEYGQFRKALRGMGLISITATFFIYNFTLLPIVLFAGGKFNISDLFVHVSVPLLYIADWVLFDKKQQFTKKSPYIWLLYPIIYVITIFSLGAKDNFYPYFFLDLYQLPAYIVIIFVVIIIMIFLALSYIYILLDSKLKNPPEIFKRIK